MFAKKNTLIYSFLTSTLFLVGCGSDDDGTEFTPAVITTCPDVDYSANVAPLSVGIQNGAQTYTFDDLKYNYIKRDSIFINNSSNQPIDTLYRFKVLYTNYDVATTVNPFETLARPAKLSYQIISQNPTINATYTNTTDMLYNVYPTLSSIKFDYRYDGIIPLGFVFDNVMISEANMTNCLDHTSAINLTDNSSGTTVNASFTGTATLAASIED